MATLLVGGSFNPITVAHLLCARFALENGGFKEAIFIPAGNAPHKNDLIPFDLRLEMVRSAIKDQPGFDVSPNEGWWAENGKTYTINTYRFMVQYLDTDCWWLIGADNVKQIPKWFNFTAIQQEMKFAVIPRPGEIALDEAEAYLNQHKIQHKLVASIDLPISSTMVRNRVEQKLSIDHIVPDAVAKIIKRENIYSL